MKNILIYGADRHLGFAFARHVLQQGDTVTLLGHTTHQVQHAREQLIRLHTDGDTAAIDTVCMGEVANAAGAAAVRLGGSTHYLVFAGIPDLKAADLSGASVLSRNIKRMTDATGGPQYVRVVFELQADPGVALGGQLARIKQALASQLGTGVSLSITAVHPVLADASTPLPPGIAPTKLHAGISKILRTLDGVQQRSRAYFQQYPTWLSAVGLSDLNVVNMSECVAQLSASLDADACDDLIAGGTFPIETVLMAISASADCQVRLAPQPGAALQEPVSCLVQEVLGQFSGAPPALTSTTAMTVTAIPMNEADFATAVAACVPPARSSAVDVAGPFAHARTLPSGVTYYSSGTGSHAVLVINAFGLSIDFWREFIQLADTKFKFLIIDRKQASSASSLMQGYYISDDFMSTLITDVKAVMDEEDASAFHIASWCAGGKLALALASALPGRVRSITFIAPSFAGVEGFAGADTTYERSLHMMSTLVAKSPQMAGTAAKSMMTAIMKSESDPTRFSPERKDRVNVVSLPDEVHRPLLHAPFVTAENMLDYCHQVIRFRNHDIKPALSDVAVLRLPVLLVTGNADTNTSTERAIDVFKRFENIVSVDLNDGGHFLLHQKCDTIARLFHHFTEEHDNLKTLTAEAKAGSGWL